MLRVRMGKPNLGKVHHSYSPCDRRLRVCHRYTSYPCKQHHKSSCCLNMLVVVEELCHRMYTSYPCTQYRKNNYCLSMLVAAVEVCHCTHINCQDKAIRTHNYYLHMWLLYYHMCIALRQSKMNRRYNCPLRMVRQAESMCHFAPH